MDFDKRVQIWLWYFIILINIICNQFRNLFSENFSQPANPAEQKRQIAPIGTTVTLKCKAGNPDARYTINRVRWIKDNVPVPNRRDEGETLKLINVQTLDAGRYYCEIEAREGVFTDYIDLEVTGE